MGGGRAHQRSSISHSLSSYRGTAASDAVLSLAAAIGRRRQTVSEKCSEGTGGARFPSQAGFNSFPRRLTEDQVHRAGHDERVDSVVRPSPRLTMFAPRACEGVRAVGSYLFPVEKKCDLARNIWGGGCTVSALSTYLRLFVISMLAARNFVLSTGEPAVQALPTRPNSTVRSPTDHRLKGTSHHLSNQHNPSLGNPLARSYAVAHLAADACGGRGCPQHRPASRTLRSTGTA